MARRELAVAENVPGDLFVDDSCIECDTCRELAPEVFGSTQSGQSFVLRQPPGEASWQRALQAVVSCPTASIGAERSAKEAARSLPALLDGPVYRCGYSSEASYGAQSWLVRREEAILEPDLPIVDPHHHLVDRENTGRYLLPELLADKEVGSSNKAGYILSEKTPR